MSALLSPRLRVLVVNPFGEVGGAELYLLRLLDATDRLEVRAVLLRDGPLRGELERRGIPVSVVAVGATARAIARGAVRLVRVLARSDCDVVLANGVKAQAVVGPAARTVGVPVVWVKHDHSYDGTLTRVLARLADTVVATAADVAAASERADVVLIEPPRAPEPASRDDALLELGRRGVDWRTDRRYVAMLTRLTPYKGVDTAIRALADSPHWHLVVLGGDDPTEPGERDRLGALAGAYGVSDRVSLLGFVDGAPRLLEAFDALAVLTRDGGPRTPGREGFGMAAMEAMVAGLPVLAPDDGGAVALRTEGGAGVLVDATDPADVARGLGRLAGDDARARMAREARRRARQFEPADAAADRLVAQLAAACHRTGAGLRSGPAISVVTPVLDEMATLDRLVPAVVAQLREDDEFVLVDSGSTDGTRARLAAWSDAEPRLRLLEVEPCSIGASRNQGVLVAKHDVIACTDAGCSPDRHWLARLRAAMAQQGGPDLVIGTYRAAVRPERLFETALGAVAWPDPVELRRASLPVQLWLSTLGPRFSRRRVDGRSVAFTREAFRQAGGFPETCATAEDEAFGRAVLDAGARTELAVDASVTWWQRDTVGAAFRQFRGYGRGGADTGSPLLLRNDLIRASAYAALAGALVAGSPRTRALGLLGTTAVFSFPIHRILRRGQPLTAIPLLPVAQLVKDGGKLTGVLEVWLRGRDIARPRGSEPSGGRS